MIGRNKYFLSLKEVQGDSVSFGDSKKEYIMGIDEIGNSFEKDIEDVYDVNGLKYNLFSVSQICYKGNEVFLSDKCIVSNLLTKEAILTTKTCRNICVANLNSTKEENLTCVKVQYESGGLRLRILDHVSPSLLNKLASNELV